MNADQIKAICHRWNDRFGFANVAAAAGLSTSRWSVLCSYDGEGAGKTVQAHKMFEIEDALHVRDFTDAVAERARSANAEANDPRLIAVHTLEALTQSMAHLTAVLSDDTVTENEKREALANAAVLSARAQQLSNTVAAMPTGRVRLRAVV